jgi:hypothetical protein
MWSLGMDGGAARRNWAIPVGESAGGGVEKVEGLTLNWFVAADKRRGASNRPASGAQGAQPRRPPLRRTPSLCINTGDTGML